jgi:hypothetical protein
MKKAIAYLMSMLLLVLATLSSSSYAAEPEKDENRLENSGTVLKEILDVPDDIPQDLIHKADCVVVFRGIAIVQMRTLYQPVDTLDSSNSSLF